MNTMEDALRKAGLVKDEPKNNDFAKSTIQLEKKNPMNLFRSSSKDRPVFARISILDNTKRDWYTGERKPPMTVWQGVVACEGVNTINIEESKWETRTADVVRFRGIEEGKDLHKDVVSDKRLKPIHAISLERNEFQVHEILEPKPELMRQYRNVKDQITMTLHAYVFPEFYAPEFKQGDSYASYMEVREECNEAMNNPLTTHTYQLKGLDNQEDAEKWLLKNHPEEAIGFVYSTNTGNFNLQPCIDSIAPNSYLSTREEREAYIQELAKRYDIDLPPFDYREADKAIENRESEKATSAWTPSKSNEGKWKPKSKDEKSQDNDVNR